MFVELVVKDGAPGLAVDTEALQSGMAVTRCCFDGFFANGERGRGLLDCPPLLRTTGLAVAEGVMLKVLGCERIVRGSAADEQSMVWFSEVRDVVVRQLASKFGVSCFSAL